MTTLLSVVLVSAISLVGLLTLSLDEAKARRITRPLVSIAVGSLLGDAFIHLIPEAFARQGAAQLRSSLLVLSGILSFFVLEKLIRRRQAYPVAPSHGAGQPRLAVMNLAGDAVHNFIDGALIGASYLASPALGVSTTLAVICHELPQELGDLGVLLHGGLSVRKAVRLNLACAGTAILGALTTLSAGQFAGRAVSEVLVPLTAGGFVYLAAANLMPELQRDPKLGGPVSQVLLIASTLGVMALLTLLD